MCLRSGAARLSHAKSYLAIFVFYSPTCKHMSCTLYLYVFRHIECVLQRRLQKILGAFFIPGLLQPALHSLSRLRPFQVVQVIKTCSNSWATTYRVHEARRLPCFFGCADGSDDLAHYAFCEQLKGIMSQCGDEPADWSELDLLGLANPSTGNLKSIACMFYAYHAVKHLPSVRNMISAERTSNFTSTDFNIHQRVFAGSFEAALTHA